TEIVIHSIYPAVAGYEAPHSLPYCRRIRAQGVKISNAESLLDLAKMAPACRVPSGRRALHFHKRGGGCRAHSASQARQTNVRSAQSWGMGGFAVVTVAGNSLNAGGCRAIAGSLPVLWSAWWGCGACAIS